MLNATEMYTFKAIFCYVNFAPIKKKADSCPTFRVFDSVDLV